MNLFRLILILLMLLTQSATFAAGPVITGVEHLQASEGLSSDRIYSVVEDKDGVIWMGTKEGIDRFNGRELKHYPLNDDYFYGDFAARVVRLLIDEDQKLIAYDSTGRIYRYNPIFDKFEVTLRLHERFHDFVTLNTVVPDKKDRLLLCMTTGLFRLDGVSIKEITGGLNVNDVADIDGRLIVGSTTGAYLLSKDYKSRRLICDKNIQTIFYDRKDRRIYLGTFNNGLWSYRLKDGRLEKLNHGGNGMEKPVRAIERLDDSHLAIGVDGVGVYKLNTRNMNLGRLVDSEDSSDIHLNGKGVYTLLTDSYGNLWVGSYTGGITMIFFTSWPARHILHEKGNPNSVSDNNVNAIAEDSDGKIWYATDSGISIEDPSTGKWRHLEIRTVIISLLRLADGKIAAGTYGDGIYIFDKTGRVVKHINKSNSDISSNYIFSLCQSSSGDLWAATLDGGLMRFDNDYRYKKSFPVGVTFSVSITPAGKVAAATADGYYVIDPASGHMEHYASVSEQSGQSDSNASVYIISMLFSDDGTVWLGTEGGGINVYDPARHKIVKNYRIEQGLPSNDIYSLLKDRRGNIVASTGNGIAILQDTTFKSLNYLHGIAKEYNKSAGILLRDGDMIFGSVHGAVRLSPHKATGATYDAALRITGFTVYGREDDLDYRKKISRKLDKGDIRLAYGDNSFTVNFESINLPYQEDIGYQYFLENYDKEWSEVSERGTAAYKRVMPGDYTLHIRSVRMSDGTVLDEKDIHVRVASPWWSTWWAICLYIIALLLLAYFIFRYKRNQLRQKYDRDKIKFFINTAHDIKTPISLVMGPISDLQKDEDLSGKAKELISLAGTNIRKLNSNMNQLLEFERVEIGDRSLKCESIDMSEFMAMEIDCFRHAFERKKITLIFDKPSEAICMSADRYLLEMMVDNLLSNACKYTNSGGKVTVSLQPGDKELRLIVSDTGIGIPQKDQKKIFYNVHRAQNARESNESGTGFGLLQVKRIVKIHGGTIHLKSIKGQGSEFTLTFHRTYCEAAPHPQQKLSASYLEELGGFKPYSDIEGSGKTDTILLVEDNDDLRNYLSLTFAPDYDIASTSSADDAMKYLDDHYPDLIISDVMMAGIQGDDFCQAVKSNPATAGIPFILLTAKTGHDAMVAGLRKGADDYIPKPFNTEILKLKVAGMLANRDRLRKALLRQAVDQIAGHNIDKPDTDEETIESTLSKEQNEERPICEADKLFIDKVTDIVSTHLDDNEFSIDRLCREMAMSRTLFFGRIKSLTGKGPQEFIRLLRLEKAAELLKRGIAVTEVCEMTGFANPKYFSTLFKKHFGVSPSKYNEEKI